jgi:ubiquinone/menaquinone biosynthesis C-methylase UbiE
LINAARKAHPEGDYLVADAADLPFPDGTFDLVIAYNSLMDVRQRPSRRRA